MEREAAAEMATLGSVTQLASCCCSPLLCPFPCRRSQNLLSPSSVLLYLYPCFKQTSHTQPAGKVKVITSQELSTSQPSICKLACTPTHPYTSPPPSFLCLSCSRSVVWCSGCHLLPPSQELSYFVYLFCHLFTGSSSHIYKFVQVSFTLEIKALSLACVHPLSFPFLSSF